MNRSSGRTLGAVLFVAIVVATLTTAYIHFTLGGLLFLLNALGYVTLAALLVLPIGFLQRLRPLVLVALMGYTATTIVGWLIMGPYFGLAYITKAIEVGLIALIAIELWRTKDSIMPALRSLPAELGGLTRTVLRRPADG